MDKTFCVFGDSVAQAAYVKIGWVELLRAYVEEKEDDLVNFFNLGVGGNNTKKLLERFESESMARGPTSIIFAIGVGDSGYYGTMSSPDVEESVFESNLKKLIDLARKFSQDITFVGLVLGDDSILKPLPGARPGEEKSFDMKRVITYNQILEKVAGLNKCKFIRLLDKLGPEDFQDGIHPNDEGHRKMFEVIKEYF